jgi:hypothetical protein
MRGVAGGVLNGALVGLQGNAVAVLLISLKEALVRGIAGGVFDGALVGLAGNALAIVVVALEEALFWSVHNTM